MIDTSIVINENTLFKNMTTTLQDVSRHRRNTRSIEKVLVLQGGGSLGAFGCGVFKALSKLGIGFDIVSGTSIGALNASIIVGNKTDEPAKALEEFWLEVAESSYNIIPEIMMPIYDSENNTLRLKLIPTAAINAAFFGVPKMFIPRWLGWYQQPDLIPESANLASWTYLYDHTPLQKTLDKYVDYNKLRPNTGKTRLIVTAVNVLTAEHLVFDSAKQEIQAKHILASTAAPRYGFPWIEVSDGVFAWDGALMSNTPLREVMDASPSNDKEVYLVENYPQVRKRLPANRIEVTDRDRDITFSDKTSHDIETWRKMTRLIELVELMYPMIDKSKKDQAVAEMEQMYKEIVESGGAEILSLKKISRTELDSPYLLKNADFSKNTIVELINQGEQNTFQQLKNGTSDQS
jgi:NTE family protein